MRGMRKVEVEGEGRMDGKVLFVGEVSGVTLMGDSSMGKGADLLRAWCAVSIGVG